MNEDDWMYDSLTERFGENLGERQRVVDALLIAKAVAGEGALWSSNHEGIISVARFILDEWVKCEDLDVPTALVNGVITKADMKHAKDFNYTFPEGSRWKNSYDETLIVRGGDFVVEKNMYKADTGPAALPFIRIGEKEN